VSCYFFVTYKLRFEWNPCYKILKCVKSLLLL